MTGEGQRHLPRIVLWMAFCDSQCLWAGTLTTYFVCLAYKARVVMESNKYLGHQRLLFCRLLLRGGLTQ